MLHVETSSCSKTVSDKVTRKNNENVQFTNTTVCSTSIQFHQFWDDSPLTAFLQEDQIKETITQLTSFEKRKKHKTQEVSRHSVRDLCGTQCTTWYVLLSLNSPSVLIAQKACEVSLISIHDEFDIQSGATSRPNMSVTNPCLGELAETNMSLIQKLKTLDLFNLSFVSTFPDRTHSSWVMQMQLIVNKELC
jgi:hypothetical protein